MRRPSPIEDTRLTPALADPTRSHPSRSPIDGPDRRWHACRVVVAAALSLALTVTGAALFRSGAWAATTTPAPTSVTPTPAPTSPPAPTPVSAGAAPTTKAWAATWTTTLRPGMRGSAVTSAQKRLQSLGYWVGKADGHYGTLTTQAVLALQKSYRMKRTGVIDAATRAALTKGLLPKARTRRGSAIEVDLARQIVIIVAGGRTRWVLNTSTGSGKVYYLAGRRQVAVTPKGRFAINRQINGLRVAPLGALWRPKYFHGGYAIHGSPSIPAYPASHGCARVSNPAMNWLWSSGNAPIGRTVWIY
jgi:peptidoglycan hydrolase-like protein with peptidoglycan-binding domain